MKRSREEANLHERGENTNWRTWRTWFTVDGGYDAPTTFWSTWKGRFNVESGFFQEIVNIRAWASKTGWKEGGIRGEVGYWVCVYGSWVAAVLFIHAGHEMWTGGFAISVGRFDSFPSSMNFYDRHFKRKWTWIEIPLRKTREVERLRGQAYGSKYTRRRRTCFFMMFSRETIMEDASREGGDREGERLRDSPNPLRLYWAADDIESLDRSVIPLGK